MLWKAFLPHDQRADVKSFIMSFLNSASLTILTRIPAASLIETLLLTPSWLDSSSSFASCSSSNSALDFDALVASRRKQSSLGELSSRESSERISEWLEMDSSHSSNGKWDFCLNVSCSFSCSNLSQKSMRLKECGSCPILWSRSSINPSSPVKTKSRDKDVHAEWCWFILCRMVNDKGIGN